MVLISDILDWGSLVLLLGLLLLLILKPEKTQAERYFLVSLVFILIYCLMDVFALSKYSLGRLAHITFYTLIGPFWYFTHNLS